MSSRPATPYRVVIVDDEPPARALLSEYVAAADDFEVVGECANGFEAVRAVSELSPDLLLLDIQMPKVDGFELLELLDELPEVIFTTAHEEYALKAFEVHAVDYLLKPFTAERFHEALARARERIEREELTPLAELAAQAAGGGAPRRRLLVRQGAEVHVVPVERLDYAEAQDDYVELHAGGEVLRKKQTLKTLESQLDPELFVRIHRCFLLQLDRLRRLEPYSKDSKVAVLEDGTRLPVSRSGQARLKELL